MAQYKVGLVSATNGSAVITGVGTLWVGEVSVGDIFTIVGSNAWYEVGSVDSNTQITLTANYAGTSISDSSYTISRDFTANHGFPYPQKGDIETASLIKRAFQDIDSKLVVANSEGDVTITGDLIVQGSTISLDTASVQTFTWGDNDKAIFGDGSDLQIYHNGSHSYIKESGTGNLRILAENFTVRNPADNESMIIATPDGGVTLFYDSAAKLATTSTGIDVTGDTSTDTLSVSGNTTLGDASTDTVTVNGYMGVGGAADATIGVYYQGTPGGTGPRGFRASPTFSSAATSSGASFISAPITQAASFTIGDIYNFRAVNTTKGAGSTITNLHGVYIDDQTQGTNNYGITSLVSSGTNKWNIYASGTAANYFAGSVGIGTSSPDAKLDLAANNTAGTALNVLRFTDTDTSAATNQEYGKIEFYSSDTSNAGVRVNIIAGAESATVPSYLAFGTSTAASNVIERLRIDSSGNLGLGVTPSGWGGSYKAFQIGNSNGRSLAATGAGSGDWTLAFNAVYDSTDSRWEYAYTGDSAVRYSQTGSGTHAWYISTDATPTAGNLITFNQAMTLTSSGNLLIGQTNDSSYKIATTVASSASFQNAITMTNATDSDLSIRIKTNETQIVNSGVGAALTFATNSTERARITSDGYLRLTGGGIQFNGDTAAANALDDYEEGTWTPVVADATTGGNTGSTSVSYAMYTKIGRQVTLTATLTNIDTTGMTAANIFYVRGLPFTSGTQQTAGSVRTDLITYQGGRTMVTPNVGPADSWMTFLVSGSGLIDTLLDCGDLTSGTADMAFTITYFA